MKNKHLEESIRSAFTEIYNDLDKLVYIANNANVFNHLEVRRIENKIKQNIKALEYLMVTGK
ncbi:hypothetical protein LRR81_04295 [Metabacillus sp. GX 13764]|uniref:hypothetical protein n=1 Tax=Metabacillus kandeliae TaxID=2900151 RepID=UPI001E3A1C86|nr:hypothetical protein [Metabacillus kandeliae]MCD7033440.1 hypothetical protein [Metabacillus kandeliae]